MRRDFLAALGSPTLQPTAVQKIVIKSEIKGVMLAIKKEKLP
jgi:hypothetical protein